MYWAKIKKKKCGSFDDYLYIDFEIKFSRYWDCFLRKFFGDKFWAETECLSGPKIQSYCKELKKNIVHQFSTNNTYKI